MLPVHARPAAGLPASELLTASFDWQIGRNYVRLGPGQSHVLQGGAG